ncbi:MAG: chemotaxis protein CheC [Sulfuricurvum sp. PC08-66]|nr:MAG: chemotaxis protein CheC [Sulfuricurvum sp. PC08-66]
MKPTVKNRVATFAIQGFVDGTNAPFFIAMDDVRYTHNLKVDMVLISLKKVVYFNVNGLDILTEALLAFRKKMKVTVGYCDLDKKKYEMILRFNQNDISFSLYQTYEIAMLFARTNKNNTQKKLLIWNEEPSQRNAIAIDLFERGHNPIVAQSLEDFATKRAKKELFDAIIEHTYLGFSSNKIATRVTGNAIIYTIKGFLDAEIFNMFDLSYHSNCLNVDFKLFIFDAVQVVAMNVHALNFFSKLTSSAAEYNAVICIAGMEFVKTPVAYKNELEDAGVLFYESLGAVLKNKELLKELTAQSSTSNQNKRNINKVLVNNLPNFIDATVSSFEMMTNAKAQKKSAAVTLLNIPPNIELYASSIGFYGNIDGIIMLVFPKSVALKASQLLLGEDNPPDEMVLDTIAEFVNIVGGKVKSILSDNENLDVDITLPRTYDNIDAFRALAGEKKGVQVDFLLGSEHFTFFLTR